MRKVAIATYIDNNENIINEFQWLYKSWLYSGSWRTSQIVAFHHPNITRLPQDPNIRYVSLEPLTSRDISWQEYPWINSTEFLTTPEAAILADYEYVLKTDNDCFLTPYFPNFEPRLATFGIAMSMTEPSVVSRLSDISERWGIKPFFNSVGSTFITKSNQVLQYAQIHMECCKRLREEEFKDGWGMWPQWWFGVLTMYGGQLAANAYFGMNMTMGGFDVHCMCHDEMKPTDYHIHAWHTYEDFSKFKWREGKYSRIDRGALDPNIIADYCLWIAGNMPCE